MEGGKWQRLLHVGVMQTFPVLHAVAKSGLIGFVDASEQDLLLSPRGGCRGRLEAIFRRAVCATAGSDGDGWRLSRCVLRAIRTELCRALDGVAVQRSGVSPKMT